MLFNSFVFLFGFLPLAFFATYVVARNRNMAKIALTLMSLGFYTWWRPIHLPLLLFSIVFNYFVGGAIQDAYAQSRQRWITIWLTFGVMVDLLLLGWFKYANFIATNLEAASGIAIPLAQIALPLAISFYTFQKIAYLVDSARGVARRMTFLDFTLFASFFPQLIAGPIVHYKEVVPQFQSPLFGRLLWNNVLIGLTIMAIGLFKKTVIADSISLYVGPLYGLSEQGGSFSLTSGWLAALTFTLQVYFDFSGYSDMAIGLGRMFGVKLPLNFHSPLRASNIVEYWRRWHMTLQRFIYAYLFQPLSLSVNRWAIERGLSGWSAFAVGIAFPTLITFIAVGIWHGAGWTFVVFGVMQAIYVVAYEVWEERRGRLRRKLRKLGKTLPEPAPTERVLAHVLTLAAILFSNVVFRARDLHAATAIWAGMIGFGGDAQTPELGIGMIATLAVASAIVVFFPNTQQIMGRFDPAYNWDEWRDTAPALLSWRWSPTTAGLIATSFILFLGVMFIQRGQAVFLYFNF